MLWICANWEANWEAIGAVATAGATLVALAFGLREVLARRASVKGRRISVATALLHPLQIAHNQAVGIGAALKAGGGEPHRARISELGAVVNVMPYDSMAAHAVEPDLFGAECAAAFAYALSLIQDVNRFGVWLSSIREPNDEQWVIVKEQFGYTADALDQAAAALKTVEKYVKPHVPKSVMVLRFGETVVTKDALQE